MPNARGIRPHLSLFTLHVQVYFQQQGYNAYKVGGLVPHQTVASYLCPRTSCESYLCPGTGAWQTGITAGRRVSQLLG